MKTRAAARRKNHKILREIAMYREIIHKYVARNKERLGQNNQFDPFKEFNNTTSLSRLLEIRQELARQGLDPTSLLRRALANLEDEWAELE